ncbi:MAG: hypothetical protein GTO14_05515 [Anaerolineales bacterium]|nr:hypothetical protein [Anaerolineales bacterium]
MRHQPFETWLFEQEELSGQELRALNEHLKICESCSTFAVAWSAVERKLRGAPSVAPAAGFSTRWRARLLEERKVRHQRQTLSIVFALTVGLIGLWTVAGAQLTAGLQAILPDVIAWMGQVVDVISHLNVVREIWGVILGILISGLPWIFRVGVPALLVVLAILWLSSIYRLVYLPMRRRF